MRIFVIFPTTKDFKFSSRKIALPEAGAGCLNCTKMRIFVIFPTTKDFQFSKENRTPGSGSRLSQLYENANLCNFPHNQGFSIFLKENRTPGSGSRLSQLYENANLCNFPDNQGFSIFQGKSHSRKREQAVSIVRKCESL